MAMIPRNDYRGSYIDGQPGIMWHVHFVNPTAR